MSMRKPEHECLQQLYSELPKLGGDSKKIGGSLEFGKSKGRSSKGHS